MKEVWQCGHCGVVYDTKWEANECCGDGAEDGYAERSNRCEKCNTLYHHTITECNCKGGEQGNVSR